MASHQFFSFLFFFLISTTYSDINADRSALLRLIAAIRGRTIQWNKSSTTPCTWDGVRCDTTINRVVELRLPGDGLSGDLPLSSIGNLTQLRTLSLRGNSLSGILPSDIGSCTSLRILNLQDNNFSGEIPVSFFNLNNLVRVSLSGNRFFGEISGGFNNFTTLRTLFLENNNFSGSLPDLNNLSQLNQFNVSFNRLTGSIPSSLSRFLAPSFLGNSICGPAGTLGPCPNEQGNDSKLSGGAIAGIVIGSVFGLILVVIALFVLVRGLRSKRGSGRVNMSPVSPLTRSPVSPLTRSPVKPREHQLPTPNSILTADMEMGISERKAGRVREKVCDERTNGMVFFGESSEFFNLEDLLKAEAEILGKGFIGTTYKAYLNGGAEVVVKRMRNVSVGEKDFRERVEELGGIGHDNLVGPRAYYYGREEKLIVFDCMPTNLSTVLHGEGASKEELTWVIRSRIVLGVATGLEYLHSLGPNVAHGNIKSSNILLSEYYDASLSEFGITQLISSTSNSRMTGYCAPEVTDIRNISQKSDVYSFGVLLLEILTGKNPSSKEEGIDLPKWVKSVVEERWTVQVFDPELIRFQNSEEQMVSLLHLAISCTFKHPQRRPPMAEITRRIKEICR